MTESIGLLDSTKPPIDSAVIEFYDADWLNQYPLTPETVLDYFKLSWAHYDATSINGILDMQTRFASESSSAEGAMGKDPTQMTGIEFVLLNWFENEEGVLYIIQKHRRDSSEKVVPLCFYYILNGYIYQAPTLKAILNTRVLTLGYYLHDAFERAAQAVTFDLSSKGYMWQNREELLNNSADMKEINKPLEPAVDQIFMKALHNTDVHRASSSKYESTSRGTTKTPKDDKLKTKESQGTQDPTDASKGSSIQNTATNSKLGSKKGKAKRLLSGSRTISDTASEISALSDDRSSVRKKKKRKVKGAKP